MESHIVNVKNVDHCHETNKIRGLLCGKCNTLLGNAADSIEILEASIEYLQKSDGLVNTILT